MLNINSNNLSMVDKPIDSSSSNLSNELTT